MKKIIAALAVVFFCMILVGCSDTSDKMPLFVYAFGCDAKKDGTDGVILYAVVAKEESGDKKSAKESNTNKGGKNENQNSSSDSSGNNAIIYEYEGKSISDAYEKFFKEHKDAYTGTVKEYVVGELLGEEGVYDFKVYLTNSPKLPVKRKIHTQTDTAGYFNKNLYRLVK